MSSCAMMMLTVAAVCIGVPAAFMLYDAIRKALASRSLGRLKAGATPVAGFAAAAAAACLALAVGYGWQTSHPCGQSASADVQDEAVLACLDPAR